MAKVQQFCTFFVAGQYFGLDVLKVQEINHYQVMTRVPLALPTVRGLINMRGQIVAAIDLRRRLELPDRPAGQAPVNVVVKTDDGLLSLLVDEVGDVLRVNESAFEKPPDTIKDTARDLIRGAYKLKDRLLLLLDINKLLTPDNGDAASTERGAHQPSSQGAGRRE
jgi:purine-binding chemotaxis protein CheW